MPSIDNAWASAPSDASWGVVSKLKPPSRRLLILACSRCKRPDRGLLLAVERYDGPAFRVLRRFLREGQSEAPDVRVLSAEHGLISHDLPIANYDKIMTSSRAHEFSWSV